MTPRDFWSKATVAVLGGGSWGTVLAQLAAQNVAEVRLWVRDPARAAEINRERRNRVYAPELELSPRVRAFSAPDEVFRGGVHAVLWVLPSKACRSEARELARYFTGSEILIHATKGIEEGSMKRVSELLREELPCPRIGVVSGPNLAAEVARGEPAATVVASRFQEVIEAGRELLMSPRFRVYSATDVVGVEWAGTLKNVLAIGSGAVDALGYGWNSRAMLMTRGLAEMVRFGVALGSNPETFLGLAGVGDLLATCSSPLSRNYRVGFGLAKGRALAEILRELGSTAEGVRTAEAVWSFAEPRGIDMPITEAVTRLVRGEKGIQELLGELMARPSSGDAPWSSRSIARE
jgi:glycerol-3-phosphate dehydrogenase (NAD(P)+)